jgi:hypothetical protein
MLNPASAEPVTIGCRELIDAAPGCLVASLRTLA